MLPAHDLLGDVEIMNVNANDANTVWSEEDRYISDTSAPSPISIADVEDPGLYVPFTIEQMIECAWKFSYQYDENGLLIDQVYAAQTAFSWWRDAAELAGAPYEEILFAQDQASFAEQAFTSGSMNMNIYDKTPIFWAKYFQVWDAVDVLENDVATN